MASHPNGYRGAGNALTFNYPNSSGSEIPAHTPVLSGARPGITVTTIPDGKSGVCDRTGAYWLKKKTGEAWDPGDELFLDGDTLAKAYPVGSSPGDVLYVFGFVHDQGAVAADVEGCVEIAPPGLERVVP